MQKYGQKANTTARAAHVSLAGQRLPKLEGHMIDLNSAQ
jgi:hypothetical protein